MNRVEVLPVVSTVSDFCRRRALELYPQLARAVPPKGIAAPREIPLRMGKFPFTVSNYFWNDHLLAHALRHANDSTAVVGPIRAQGYCLHPLRSDGDLMFFDPTLPAQHGDIVLFQFEDSDASASAERAELHFMSKILVEFAGEYFLAFNTGMFPLGDIRILGVEVPAPGAATPVVAPAPTAHEMSRRVIEIAKDYEPRASWDRFDIVFTSAALAVTS